MRRQTFLLIDTLLLGVVGALGAEAFRLLLQWCQRLFLERMAGYVPPGLPSEGGALQQVVGSHWLWLVPLVLVLGGLISGVLVYALAPEAEGHGTDTAVKAFHQEAGFIRTVVTPVKILASAITIGSGGSAGREGPTALFSAGFGSLYATLLKRPDPDRRLLVLIGMAAGLSAIFRSPIGTAIFAVEVLYSDMEFEGEALLYTMLGSVVAYTCNTLFVGRAPLFAVPHAPSGEHLSDYGWYVLLGLASGILGVILPNVFYSTRDLFHRLHVVPHLKPAIGACGVGLLALVFPQVLGGGYGWIQEAINGSLATSLLLALVFGKMVAFSLTVSSGGSGGVFAPTLFIGAMLGSLLAHLFHQPSSAFAVIGMAAMFGSAARVPIATILMVTEMTGGYYLLVPAALAVMLAFFVQGILASRLRVRYRSLYEAQVRRSTDSPAHRMELLQAAVQTLSERRNLPAEVLRALDLRSILQARVPLDISGSEQLFLGTLNSQSPCVGTRVGGRCLGGEGPEWEIVAIFREGSLIFPHSETVLEPEDEVLILASREAVAGIRKNLDGAERPSAGG